MQIVKIDKHQVNLNIQGTGETVLFLHGVPDSSEIWSGITNGLSKYYQCIAPDLPGFGLTNSPRSFQYDLDSLADFTNQLLNALKAESKVHLVVHDIGGIVGLAFATKYPERIKSLTIMDTTFFANHEWHTLAKIWRKPVVGDLAMHLMGYKQFSAAMKKAAPVLTEQQIQSNYEKLTFKNRRMILKFYRTLDPTIFEGWEDRLREVTSTFPTQVIWGEKDSFLPVSLATRFGAQQVHVLKNVGHWPMLEKEQQVAQLIRKNATLADENKVTE